jgi:hypothetical protein
MFKLRMRRGGGGREFVVTEAEAADVLQQGYPEFVSSRRMFDIVEVFESDADQPGEPPDEKVSIERPEQRPG